MPCYHATARLCNEASQTCDERSFILPSMLPEESLDSYTVSLDEVTGIFHVTSLYRYASLKELLELQNNSKSSGYPDGVEFREGKMTIATLSKRTRSRQAEKRTKNKQPLPDGLSWGKVFHHPIITKIRDVSLPQTALHYDNEIEDAVDAALGKNSFTVDQQEGEPRQAAPTSNSSNHQSTPLSRKLDGSLTGSVGFARSSLNFVEATPLSYSASSDIGLVDVEDGLQKFQKRFSSKDDLSTIMQKKKKSGGDCLANMLDLSNVQNRSPRPPSLLGTLRIDEDGQIHEVLPENYDCPQEDSAHMVNELQECDPSRSPTQEQYASMDLDAVFGDEENYLDEALYLQENHPVGGSVNLISDHTDSPDLYPHWHGGNMSIMNQTPHLSSHDWWLQELGNDGQYYQYQHAPTMPSTYQSEEEGLPIHHLNFDGTYVYQRCHTPPEISFWAAATTTRKELLNKTLPNVHYAAVLTAQAFRWVDPTKYVGADETLLWAMEGSAMKDAATGTTIIVYEDIGTWKDDRYPEDEVAPIVAPLDRDFEVLTNGKHDFPRLPYYFKTTHADNQVPLINEGEIPECRYRSLKQYKYRRSLLRYELGASLEARAALPDENHDSGVPLAPPDVEDASEAETEIEGRLDLDRKPIDIKQSEEEVADALSTKSGDINIDSEDEPSKDLELEISSPESEYSSSGASDTERMVMAFPTDGRYCSPSKMLPSRLDELHTPVQSPSKDDDHGSWDTDGFDYFEGPGRSASENTIDSGDEDDYSQAEDQLNSCAASPEQPPVSPMTGTVRKSPAINLTPDQYTDLSRILASSLRSTGPTKTTEVYAKAQKADEVNFNDIETVLAQTAHMFKSSPARLTGRTFKDDDVFTSSVKESESQVEGGSTVSIPGLSISAPIPFPPFSTAQQNRPRGVRSQLYIPSISPVIEASPNVRRFARPHTSRELVPYTFPRIPKMRRSLSISQHLDSNTNSVAQDVISLLPAPVTERTVAAAVQTHSRSSSSELSSNMNTNDHSRSSSLSEPLSEADIKEVSALPTESKKKINTASTVTTPNLPSACKQSKPLSMALLSLYERISFEKEALEAGDMSWKEMRDATEKSEESQLVTNKVIADSERLEEMDGMEMYLFGLPFAVSLAALAFKVGKWALGKGAW